MKVFMQHLQYHIWVSFLITLLIVACNPETLSDLSEAPNQTVHQPLPTKADLVKEEKILETTAVQTLDSIFKQLQEEKAPSKSLFKKLNKQFKKDIKKAKKDSNIAADLVKNTHEVQDALQTLIGDLNMEGKAIVIDQLHPNLQAMFNAVVNIPEVSDANIANGGTGRLINKDNLQELTKWYDGVVQRHFKHTNSYNIHINL